MKKIKIICKLCAVLSAVAIVFAGCSNFINSDTLQTNGSSSKAREWTTIIYMAADNDLEAAALADMKELESVDMRNSKCDVLVLLDRSKGHDETNGNWTDTRLFKVAYNRGSNSGEISSMQIECPELEIYDGKQIEHNMGDANTLRRLLRFTARVYPAEHYALIIWGHGSGWRGASADDESDSLMSTFQLANVMNELPLDIIAFDTCFGAIVENAYEFSGKAKWLVASEGITPTDGWNYEKLFSSFMDADEKTVDVFCESIISQYKHQYNNEPLATISKIDLTKIDGVVESIDTFSKYVAETVDISNHEAMRSLFFENTLSYNYSKYPCDMYLDIFDMAQQFIENENEDIARSASDIQTALSDCVVESWSGYNDENPHLGILFMPLKAQGVLDSKHDNAYFNGMNQTELPKFVRNCTGWVPSIDKNNGSLLDKIIYIGR